MTATGIATATDCVRPGVSNRAWFDDRRSSERRLQVTSHGDTIVFSIWHGAVCTGTAQVPIAETPRLIAHVAQCLSQADITVGPAAIYRAPPRSARGRARRALGLAAAWFRSRGRGSAASRPQRR